MLATAISWMFVATNPAAMSFTALALSQSVFAARARSSGVASAVFSTYPDGADGIGRGAGSPGKVGSSGARRARSEASSAARRMPSSSSRFVVAVARRVPSTTRTRSSASRLVTFWWIAELAKRVSETVFPMTSASA